MSTIFLPPNHTPDDASIWREAVRRGMRTFRGRSSDDYSAPDDLPYAYYGNALHREQIRLRLPSLLAARLDPLWVTRVDGRMVFLRRIESVTWGAFEMLWPGGGEHPLFLKCCHEKWFPPAVYGHWTDIPSRDVCKAGDWLHIQDPVDFVHEARCFVLHGKVHTASCYRKDRQFHPEHVAEPPAEWQRLVDLCMKGLTSCVVVDVGMLADGRWCVVEANEPWASGIYECDPARCLDVILAAQGFPTP